MRSCFNFKKIKCTILSILVMQNFWIISQKHVKTSKFFLFNFKCCHMTKCSSIHIGIWIGKNQLVIYVIYEVCVYYHTKTFQYRKRYFPAYCSWRTDNFLKFATHPFSCPIEVFNPNTFNAMFVFCVIKEFHAIHAISEVR